MALDKAEPTIQSAEGPNQLREQFGTGKPGEVIKVTTEGGGFLGTVEGSGDGKLTVRVDESHPTFGGQTLVIKYEGEDLPDGGFKYSIQGSQEEKDSGKLTRVGFPHRKEVGPTL